MCLYSDQLAWINSKSKDSNVARRETLNFDLPNIDYCWFLFEKAIDYGLKPEWSELNAWNILTDARLHPFESKAIHLISVTYQNKHSEYNGTDSPRPFLGTSAQSSDSIKSALRKNNG